jgi:hypothetical protein
MLRVAATKAVGGSSMSFLTAAEQRLVDKKADKEREEMYSFLKEGILTDVRLRFLLFIYILHCIDNLIERWCTSWRTGI